MSDNKSAVDISIEQRTDGIYVKKGDREVGPFESFTDIKSSDVATKIGADPKEVFTAVFRARQPTEIGHLNMIEGPSFAGMPIKVDGIISSTSIAYLVPKLIEGYIVDEQGQKEDVPPLNIEIHDPINMELVGVNVDVKYRRLKRAFGNLSGLMMNEREYRTVYMVRVRPPVFTLEKRGEKIVDEKGFEYKSFDIYVVSDQALIFRPSTLMKITGIPLGSPKTQKIVLLASKVEFPEDASSFDMDALKKLKARFDKMGSVKERKEWILDNFEKFSGIVGRRNLAHAGLLAFFSPLWIKLGNQVQRGWAVVLFVGDTTTGKSETVLKLISLLNAGMFITAETASVVGLTGTATQLEKEGWFVDWGFLVLCDGKLLAVDGVHKLPISCWASMAEAERQGVVTIGKAAKDSAYARTRQIKIANPLDTEAGRFKTKALGELFYSCQALPTILDSTGIARLDFAVFSNMKDVQAAQVNVKTGGTYDPDLILLSEALKWRWSGKARDEFLEEAVDEILTSATDLCNDYFSPSVPLVSIDMKWKLARLSASLAAITLSTNEDFTAVRITKEHVKEVVDSVRAEYSKSQLNTLAQSERFEVLDLDDVNLLIDDTVRKINSDKVDRAKVKEIWKKIVLSGRVTKDILQAEFGLSDHNEARPLIASLLNQGLIRSGKGYYPKPKLIQAYKILEGESLSLPTGG